LNKKISIVIPFLNEDINKVKSLIDNWALDRLISEIILVDDCSDKPLVLNNAKVIRNQTRVGSAASRDIGIKASSGSIIITTDAHVSPKTKGWIEKLIAPVLEDRKTIVCPICIPAGNSQFKGSLYGASLDIFAKRNGQVSLLNPIWNTKQPSDSKIECIMGGAYVFDASWYREIGGYSGIKGWCPTEMVAISLKTRLAGGRCVVARNVEMEHEFRAKPPFPIGSSKTAYNKMRLATVTLPPEYATMITKLLTGTPMMKEAITEYMRDFKDIMAEKGNFQSICNCDLHEAVKRAGIDFGVSIK
jgi:GT2 family glycosyltransferase